MSDVVIEVIEEVINVEVQEPEAFEVVEAGIAGPQGPAGNSILTGSGVPSNSLGVDGDIYFRDNGDVYKKISGAWNLFDNLVGPSGADGADGADGATIYVGNIDGGSASSVYGGSLQIIDGGNA